MAFNKMASKFIPRRILEVAQFGADNAVKFVLGQNAVSNGKVATEGEEKLIKDANGSTMFSIPQGKSCKVTFDVHVRDLALFAAMNGTEREIGSETNKIRVPVHETITIGEGVTEITLPTGKPIVNDGTTAEPVYNISVCKLSDEGSLEKNFTQGSAAAGDVFTCTNTKLTFAEGTLAEGDTIEYMYEYETAEAATLSVDANTYPVAGKMRFRVEGCTVCNPEELIDVWYTFPNALLSVANELDMGDPEQVVSVTATASYSYCGGNQKFYSITLADD
jgi:hypothetical protein